MQYSADSVDIYCLTVCLSAGRLLMLQALLQKGADAEV